MSCPRQDSRTEHQDPSASNRLRHLFDRRDGRASHPTKHHSRGSRWLACLQLQRRSSPVGSPGVVWWVGGSACGAPRHTLDHLCSEALTWWKHVIIFISRPSRQPLALSRCSPSLAALMVSTSVIRVKCHFFIFLGKILWQHIIFSIVAFAQMFHTADDTSVTAVRTFIECLLWSSGRKLGPESDNYRSQ